MLKANYKEVKKHNKELLLCTIMEKGKLSRIELAHETKLSPSTVTALVKELLEAGILSESGEQTITAGRSRMALEFSPEIGYIAIVSIRRDGVQLALFDMNLQYHASQVLSNRYLSGNELFVRISQSVLRLMHEQNIRLSGFGLLLQENTAGSDRNVLYSTGCSSANITLKEALSTQFQVPVFEEYSQIYTLQNALNPGSSEKVQQAAYISIGRRVIASIVVHDRPVTLHDGMYADITSLVCGDVETMLSPYLETQTTEVCVRWDAIRERLAAGLANAIAMLCTLFSLDAVFLTGGPTEEPVFLEQLDTQLQEKLPEEALPDIHSQAYSTSDATWLLAQQVRQKVLLTL